MKSSPADLESSLKIEEESVESRQREIAVPDYGFHIITSPSTGICNNFYYNYCSKWLKLF